MKRKEQLTILIVEDNPGDYILVHEYLRLSTLELNKIIHSFTISGVAEAMNGEEPDMVLLDLTLPDSRNEESVIAIVELFPKAPVIVFSGMEDIELSLRAIQLGAQDYLLKGEFDEHTLTKAIQYAVERKRVLEILRENDERFKMLIQATNDIVWDWDMVNNTIVKGPGMAELLGYSNNKVGKDMEWVFYHMHEKDLPRVKNKIDECIQRGIQYWNDEFRLITAEGGIKFILGRGNILFDSNKRPYRMIFSMTDLTKIKTLEAKLTEEKINRQKLIAATTLDAQEQEKNQLGKELHDNISQIMATVKLYLGMIKPNSDGEQVKQMLEQSREYVNMAITEIRKLSHSLVAPSLGDVSLQQALQKLTGGIAALKIINIDLHINIPDKFEIDPSKELALYRIVQEQLNNIQKYAKCKNVIIELKAGEEGIYLKVEDDGIGFDMKEKADGIGIKNIKNRVAFYSGSVNITAAPGEGCRLEILIP